MVDWMKQINAPSTTTADIFAGDIMNNIMQYYNDIDLAAGGDPAGVVSIATETRFASGKLVIWDLNKDHYVTLESPNFAENKTINLPSTMTTTDEIVLEDAGAQLTQKTIPTNLNVLNHSTTNAAGDILKGNGTSYQRLPRGTANQVLAVNSGGTDVAWSSFDSERVGKSTASGNGSATVFNISHGLGTNPTYAWINCSSLINTFTYATNSTNIVVTFTPTPPPSGTSNVIIYWRVVA